MIYQGSGIQDQDQDQNVEMDDDGDDDDDQVVEEKDHYKDQEFRMRI